MSRVDRVRRWRLTATLVCAAVAATGCASETATGEGTLDLTLSGEEGARDGYPLDLGGGEVLSFIDGWQLRFDHVAASIGDFSLASADGAHEPLTSVAVADVHTGDAHLGSMTALPARRFDRVGYRLVPVTTATRNIGDVAPDVLNDMRAGSCSIYLSGTATRDALTVPFRFCFPLTVHAAECVSGVDSTSGIAIAPNTTTTGQITLHIDHVFLDSLVDPHPPMRFDAIAAAVRATPGATVTLADLASQPLADLRGLDGNPLVDASGAAVRYEAPVDHAAHTLRDMLIENAATMVHWQGEGHCEYRVE